MFLLYEYDFFWAFLIISILVPILAFFISGVLAPISKGQEKLSTYESGIEPMGDAWLQFRIRYYMFALVFVVFDVETVFLYPWYYTCKFAYRCHQAVTMIDIRSILELARLNRLKRKTEKIRLRQL